MKIPKTELLVPGVLCRTKQNGNFVITSNELRTRFSLWKQHGDDYDKIATNKTITALYEKVPWFSK